MPKAKRRKFRMHPRLLYDVIQRQAGTLGKAILEGAMNCVDAKASYCTIALDQEVLIIEDDGKGFPSMGEIEKYFETFGQPHEAHEEKLYGNFRMGRGQLFAFGENTWESGEFRMEVDFKGEGDGYTLHDKQALTEGCCVTVLLYKKLSPSELAGIEREVKKYVKYMPIDVFLNDELVSTDPATQKWDYESDNCYVNLRQTGDLDVYNLGAFVKGFPTSAYGRGGEVVSKQQLKLNFARNDVMVSECPIWREVRRFVEKAAGKEIKRSPKMTDAERQRLADQIRFGEYHDHDPDKGDLRIITDVSGRHWSLRQLARCRQDWSSRKVPAWSVAKQGHRMGDKLHQQKLAFVLADCTLERFGFRKDDPAGFMRFLAKLPGFEHSSVSYLDDWDFRSIAQLTEGLDDKSLLLEPSQYNAHERIWIKTIEYGISDLRWYFHTRLRSKLNLRATKIGLSDSCDGWTDGATYVAINRAYLARRNFGHMESLVHVGNLLLHEYCHNEPDWDTHIHSPEFYQTYHDCSDFSGTFAANAMRSLPKRMESMRRKLTKRALKGQDLLHALDLATVKLDEALDKARIAART